MSDGSNAAYMLHHMKTVSRQTGDDLAQPPGQIGRSRNRVPLGEEPVESQAAGQCPSCHDSNMKMAKMTEDNNNLFNIIESVNSSCTIMKNRCFDLLKMNEEMKADYESKIESLIQKYESKLFEVEAKMKMIPEAFQEKVSALEEKQTKLENSEVDSKPKKKSGIGSGAKVVGGAKTLKSAKKPVKAN